MGRWIVAAAAACCTLLGVVGTASAAVDFTPATSAKPCSSTQAGGHADFCVSIGFDDHGSGDNPKSLAINLPGGLVGDPTATPKCPQATFESSTGCPVTSQVGTVSAAVTAHAVLEIPQTVDGKVYNLQPNPTEPARLGIQLDPLNIGLPLVPPIKLQSPIRVRVADAGLTSTVDNIPNSLMGISLTTKSMNLTLWGPKAGSGRQMTKPFITLPTRCDVPSTTTMTLGTYSGGSASASSSFTATNCGALPFSPSLTVGPSEANADEPGEASATLHIPDTPNADDAIRQAYLKDVALKLPAGLALNPPLANGLVPCTPEQFGFGVDAPPQCPANTEMGRVEFVTPLFPNETLSGKVYFGLPRPGVPLVNYISVEDPRLRLKLGGYATIDPNTTAITAHFEDQPQVPFTSFKFIYTDPGDGRATLTSPVTCGDYSVTADMTPWGGGATKSPSNSFKVVNCGPPTFQPGLGASVGDTQAGGPAALTVHIVRPDKNLRLESARISLPPGLTGRLPAVPACDVFAARANQCSPASQVGTAAVSVGTGPAPLSLPGKVYLTQGYDGAIAGLAVAVDTKVPALDLGTVVVMSKLFLRPDTGIDVQTEALPQSLQGIPTVYRTIDMTIDRPGFMQNATSCAAQPLHGAFTAVGGATAAADAPYAATGCEKLPFKPKLSATVGRAGEVAKGKHPPLAVTIQQADHEAAMSKTVVSLPAGVGVDLKNLSAVCTDAQLQGGACPAGSKIGTVTAQTPLLPAALSGGVYLMQGAKPGALPGIALDLGLLRLKGTVALGQRLVTTFDGIPDVPLSKLVLNLTGGPKAALMTSKDLCDQEPTVQAVYGAHSGATGKEEVKATVVGCAPLAGTAELYGIARKRPTARLKLVATKALKGLRVKLPSALKLTSSKSLKKLARVVIAGKKVKGAGVRWLNGRVAVTLPKGKSARSVQVTLPKGSLRLKRKIKTGSTQTFTVTGIPTAGKNVSAKIKAKAKK